MREVPEASPLGKGVTNMGPERAEASAAERGPRSALPLRHDAR